MSVKQRKMTLVDLPLAVALFLFGLQLPTGYVQQTPNPAAKRQFQAAAASNGPGASAARSRKILLESLRGGPIQVAACEDKPGLIGREAAIAAAARYTGFKGQPSDAWRIVLTDQEFRGQWLQGRPSWLLEYQRLPGAGDTKKRHSTWYVAIDAETGIFWEAFTRPEKPWWNDVKLKNAAFARSDRANPPREPPKVQLLSVLPEALTTYFDGKMMARQAKQIVVRYFLYTSGEGGAIHRVDGLEGVPDFIDLPIWYFSFEGVDHQEIPRSLPLWDDWDEGGKLAKPLKVPNTQEVNVLCNAETGEFMSVSMYR